jgi:hypothetical protein
MSYTVAIRKNATGEVRMYQCDFDWDKGGGHTDLFWWTDGNFGCDCNRHLSWLRAGGPGPPEDPHWNKAEHKCGGTAYSVLYAALPDGSQVEIDSPANSG